ncbi:MAG: hypothetical protein IJ867_04045 [Clostridia bacterium]|nr:hypothetical protein [Clostridia bacterium]
MDDEKLASLTVQELLEQLKTDDFEKMYIVTASQGNSKNSEELSSAQMGKVKSLAEYQLEQMLENMTVSLDEQEKLKEASNFYMVPHTVTQKYNVGNEEQVRQLELYTVNDVEGYSLYTIIDEKNISISNGFRDRIKDYLQENYQGAIASGGLSVDEVVEHFTPKSMDEMYEILGSNDTVSTRFLPARIDEYAMEKGIPKDVPERSLEKEEEKILEESENEREEVAEEEPNQEEFQEEQEQEEPEVPVESYVEKIARMNHVKPSVVNTRVIENFEKVEEDTGIRLKGKYQRGDVVAVRIPYKLGYRTFLAEKDTGMTIDGKGRVESKPRLYDFDEIEEYFRYKLRDGQDGGESGKPLRYDEGRDYTTYIDEHGELKEQKYINNGKQQDMIREERQRYLAEVAEVDQKLKEAIDEYQKQATRENYLKVREIIKEKVDIDNKYNALDEQKKVTEQTKENTEKAIRKRPR